MSIGMSTPVAQDGYSRALIELFDDRVVMPAPKGFQAFFGRPETGSSSVFCPSGEVVDIDIIRGNEKTAAYIHRGANGKSLAAATNTSTQEYSSNSYRFPLAEIEGSIGAAQLNRRLAGESPYAGASREARLMGLARDHHYDHVRRLVRLFELSAAESILLGQQSAILGTTNAGLIYDWGRADGNTITVTTAWDAVGATIMSDIDGACKQARTAGHVTPDMIVAGEDAMRAMLNDDTFQDLADNRRIGFVAIDREADSVPTRFQRFIAGGFIYRGILYTAQGYRLHLFTYPEVYEDADGAAQNYMPTDKVVITSSLARCDRYFGPPETLPLDSTRIQWYQSMFGFSPLAAVMPPNFEGDGMIVDPRMFYFDAYPSSNQKNLILRSQAAPLFPTTHTDAFVTLDGLITEES